VFLPGALSRPRELLRLQVIESKKTRPHVNAIIHKYKPRGASLLRHFFVMFLVKGAERRGQWITGAQKDLTLRWLRIY
jgi:hypothetical protein